MPVVKFDHLEKLDELAAKIFLDTRSKLSKKKLLEIIFDLGKEDYEKLVEKVRSSQSESSMIERKDFIKNFAGCLDLGEEDDIDFIPIWNQEG